MEVMIVIELWAGGKRFPSGSMFWGVKILSPNQIVQPQIAILRIGGVIWMLYLSLWLVLAKFTMLEPSDTFFVLATLNGFFTYGVIVIVTFLVRTGVASYVSDEALRLFVAEVQKKSLLRKTILWWALSYCFGFISALPPTIAISCIVLPLFLINLHIGLIYQYVVSAGVKKALALSNEVKTIR